MPQHRESSTIWELHESPSWRSCGTSRPHQGVDTPIPCTRSLFCSRCTCAWVEGESPMTLPPTHHEEVFEHSREVLSYVSVWRVHSEEFWQERIKVRESVRALGNRVNTRAHGTCTYCSACKIVQCSMMRVWRPSFILDLRSTRREMFRRNQTKRGNDSSACGNYILSGCGIAVAPVSEEGCQPRGM
jgi:hypothetical protein